MLTEKSTYIIQAGHIDLFFMESYKCKLIYNESRMLILYLLFAAISLV